MRRGRGEGVMMMTDVEGLRVRRERVEGAMMMTSEEGAEGEERER